MPCGPQGFGKRQRLLNSAQFAAVFKRGRRFSSGGFQFICADNELAYGRLGIAVSRRSVRRAHARNRIKRLIRETFRARQFELAGVDVVVMARPEIEQQTNAVLIRQLQQLFGRVVNDRASRCANPG